MRYGLPDGPCSTLEELGTYFHLTRERVRQIEVAALNTLRQHWRESAEPQWARTQEEQAR